MGILAFLFIALLGVIPLGKADLFLKRHRRTGGGNFDTINSIAQKLTLPLELSIEPKDIVFNVIGIDIPLTATIGDTGECVDLKINPGGDILITGVFLDEQVTLPGFDTPMSVYEIEVHVALLQFECTIPLMIEVDGFLSFVNTVDGFGDLTFRSEQGTLTQKLLAYSPDFQTTPPVFAAPGACEADPVLLTYTGDDLGSAVGVDLTDIVIGEIEGNPSYVFNDVKTELCKLGDDLAVAIGDFMVDNILTNTSSDFFIQAPFQPDPEDDNQIPALLLERQLRESSPDLNLLDFYDTDDFVVGLVIPDDPTDESIVNTVLEFIADPDDESNLDPLLLFLHQEFPLPLEEDGRVLNLDFISLINGSFFDGNETDGENATLDFDIAIVFEEALFIDVTISIDHLLLSVFPLPPENETAQQPPILPAFQALGNNTLLLDGVNLNRIFLDAGVTISVNMLNVGLPGNLFLEIPFEFALEESVGATIDWAGFVMTIGLLMDIDIDQFQATQVQPLIDNLFECAMSLFPLTPRVTGGLIDHIKLIIEISQMFDALFVLVADIVEVIIPVYQPTIPKAIELIIDSVLTNQELFEPETCPLADPLEDDLTRFPYDFREGIVKEISDILDAETVNDLGGELGVSDDGVFLLGSEEGDGDDLGFSVPIPLPDGRVQDMKIGIRAVSLEGILLPYFNELSVLKVIEDSPYAPQELRTIADVGKEDQPVTMRIILAVTLGNPREEEDEGVQGFVEENVLDLRFSFEKVRILLDLYLHYTKYDVDSMTFGDILNLGCWGQRLNYPGGVSIITFLLRELEVTGQCDCPNEFAQQIADTFLDPTTWDSQVEFFEDLLHRLNLLVVDIFSLEKFETTVGIAQDMCSTGEFRIDLPTPEHHAYHTPIGDLIPYMAFFGVAILVPAVIAAVLRNMGPKLNKADKNKFNHHHNKMALHQLKEKRDQSDGLMLEHLHLKRGMWRNPLVPGWAKIGVPVVTVVNLILFVIGDTGDAVAINLVGQVLGVPYNDDGFGRLSVITSVIELWKSGGILLASLMFLMSIFWPYLKLFLITLCWFLPVKILPIGMRGRIIETLDFLGRFSFAEFHFLVFVLVVLQLRTGSPNLEFLPEEDFFAINLDIVPLLSLFTFALAVVVSIMLSNVLLVLQHNIEDETRIQLREKHLLESNGRDRANSLIEEANEEDLKPMRMSSWTFTAFDREQGMNYSYTLTKTALYLAGGSVIFAFLALVAASVVDSLAIELRGFFSYLILFADGERDYALSVFKLLIQALQTYKGNPVIYVVGVVFIATIAIIPLLQTILLFYLLFKAMSVKKARRMAETHHILTVWCCVDVFVLAVTLTVLELPTVAEGLQGTLAFCDDLASFMEGILEPMEFVDHEDVISGCLSLRSSVSIGAYLAVFSVLVLNVANLIVSKLFFSYIVDRENMVEIAEKQLEDEHDSYAGKASGEHNNISSWHAKLRRWGLIEITEGSSRARAGSNPLPFPLAGVKAKKKSSGLNKPVPQAMKAPRRTSLRGSFSSAKKARDILRRLEDDPLPGRKSSRKLSKDQSNADTVLGLKSPMKGNDPMPGSESILSKRTVRPAPKPGSQSVRSSTKTKVQSPRMKGDPMPGVESILSRKTVRAAPKPGEQSVRGSSRGKNDPLPSPQTMQGSSKKAKAANRKSSPSF